MPFRSRMGTARLLGDRLAGVSDQGFLVRGFRCLSKRLICTSHDEKEPPGQFASAALKFCVATTCDDLQHSQHGPCRVGSTPIHEGRDQVLTKRVQRGSGRLFLETVGHAALVTLDAELNIQGNLAQKGHA